MTPRRKEPRSFLLIASTCALDGRNGAVLIFTKQSGGDGKGDGSPGEPSN